MDKPTRLTMVELAGWGGAAGGQLSIMLVGPMEVTYHEGGAMTLYTLGDVVGPRHALESMGADVCPQIPPERGLPLGASDCKANREAQEWFAARVLSAHPAVERGRLPSEREGHIARGYAVLSIGSTFLTHTSQIRLAG